MKQFEKKSIPVLILVVVEDGLRVAKQLPFWAFDISLNPCCGGRWSQRYLNFCIIEGYMAGLNPCCGGRWSQSESICSK